MSQMIFVNLPSSDIARARGYYAGLGYSFDERFCGPDSLFVGVSESIHLMILSREKFAHHSPQPVAPQGTTSALLCLSMDSREAVDDWMAKALAHGGTDTGEVEEQGDFMYSRAAFDPDGNGIQVMWMDVDAAMKAWSQAA
jgi:hypothetical protein